MSDDIRSCVLWIELVFGHVSGKFRSLVLLIKNGLGQVSDDIRSFVLGTEYKASV